MSKTTKVLLCLLIAAAVIASANLGSPKPVIYVLMLYGLGWLLWRCYVAVALLFSPVRKKIQPQVDVVNQHVDTTLRRSGLGGLADAAQKFQAGLDGAVKATQDGIDRRQREREVEK